MGKSLGVGIVGCGAISGHYLKTLDRLTTVRLVAVSDLDEARAQGAASGRPDVRAVGFAELVSDPAVDVVLNLTVPAVHAEVALSAIAAGKSVYGEKPLAATVVDGRKVLSAAETAGVRVGCAPDTVLGTGTQTARQAVDSGAIGVPVAATATMVTPGHERWHPHPDFYYLPGGGPLLDMGPYYLSALVTLLGPVASVVGAASRSRSERIIGSAARAGETIPVEIDTHVTGVLTHESGALSTLVMSFDVAATRSAPIEVHGTEASLVVPDPNTFGGEVLLRGIDEPDWRTLDVSAGYRDAARGYGLAEMAGDAEPRAGGQLAFHVLDIMESLLYSAKSGQAIAVDSTCQRPSPVPLGDLE